MIRTRRFLCGRAIALIALAVTCLPGVTKAASKEEAKVVLRFWNQLSFDPVKSIIQGIVDDFNDRHPTIHVETLHSSQLPQKLLTAVAGRVPPDVCIYDRFRVANFAQRGALERLDELVRVQGVRSEDFFQVCWNECLYDGRLYAVPFNTDVRVLFYNKRMFRDAGLDPERPPRTWDELRRYSERLTTRNDDGSLQTVGFVPFINFGNTWLYLFIWQNGGEILSEDGRTALIDSSENVAALEWCRDFVDFYGANNLRSFQASTAVKELEPFFVGRTAMLGEEVWMLTRIKRYAQDLDYGMAPLPWPESGRRASWSGGFSMIVPKGTAHPEEAAEFIAHMTSREIQQSFGESAFQLPANRMAVDSEFYQKPEWSAFINEMEHSRYRPTSPAGAFIWDELSRAWESGAGGGMEPAEALRRARRNVQGELDRIHAHEARPLVNWTYPTLALIAVFLAAILGRGAVSAKKIRTLTLHRKEAFAGYLFALPVMIGLLTFTLGPIAVSAVYSLCDYDVLRPARWFGFGNYRKMFAADPLFWKSLWNTLYYTILAVPASVAGSLVLAVILNNKLAARGIWRTLFYMPSIVPIVALSMLFLWLFNGDFGLFNVVLNAVGIPDVHWMASPAVVKNSLVLMNMWTVGAGMIIFLAALQGVPRYLYESALIDGAGAVQRFFTITVPMISPAIFFMIVINTINSLQIFTQAFLMTRGTGEPENSTLFYVFYLFRQGFEYFNMGYAAAMAWIIFLIILVITIVQFRLSKRLVYEESQ